MMNELGVNELGVNYENDAVYFALENQKLVKEQQELRKYALDASSAIMNMMMAFDMLTREGGWDTLPEDARNALIDYRDKAREVYGKIPF